jgi:hypothetical protein
MSLWPLSEEICRECAPLEEADGVKLQRYFTYLEEWTKCARCGVDTPCGLARVIDRQSSQSPDVHD